MRYARLVGRERVRSIFRRFIEETMHEASSPTIPAIATAANAMLKISIPVIPFLLLQVPDPEIRDCYPHSRPFRYAL